MGTSRSCRGVTRRCDSSARPKRSRRFARCARSFPGARHEKDDRGRGARIPLPGPKGEGRGRSDQALPHAGGSLARLHAGRRGAVPGDREEPGPVYEYTAKGNLVAVVTNGTAVLGLGNIGAARRQARHGRQGRPLQAVRRHRRLRHRARLAKTRTRSFAACRRSSRPSAASTSRTSRRRSASRSKKQLKKTHEDPRVPRRPARHRDHLRRRAPERPRGRRQEDRRRQGRRQRRRRRRPSPAPSSTSPRRPAREHASGRHQGRDLPRAHGRDEPVQGAVRRETTSRDAHRRAARRGRLPRALRGGTASSPRCCKTMAREPDRLRHGQPDPEITYRTMPGPPAATSSWPPAAPTTRTRSTTCSGSPSSSAARSTCARRTINEEMKRPPRTPSPTLAKEDVPDSVSQGLRRARTSSFGTRIPDPQAVRPPRAALGSAGGRRRPPWRPASRSSRSTSTSTASASRKLLAAREVMRGDHRPRRGSDRSGSSSRRGEPRISVRRPWCGEEGLAQPILLAGAAVIARSARSSRSTMEKHRGHRHEPPRRRATSNVSTSCATAGA